MTQVTVVNEVGGYSYGYGGLGLGLLEGALIGGLVFDIYLTSFYLRPWWACPPMVRAAVTPPYAYYLPRPWWAHELDEAGSSGRPPRERLPLVVFDAGRVRFCRQLDKRVTGD